MAGLPATTAAAPAAACISACPVQLSASQMFDAADRLARAGRFDRAIALLKIVTQDVNPDYRAEARVRIARYLAAQGDKFGAAYWYGQLLDEKPDASAVRIELARLLASMGEEKAAAQQLRRAQAAGLPLEVAHAINDAVELFRSNRPVGFDLSVGFAPDTNINSATSSDTVAIFGLPFQLSDDGRARSGIGLTFDGDLVLRQPIMASGRLITQITATGSIYRYSEFDDMTFAVNSGPEFRMSSTVTMRPALAVGRRIYGTDPLYDFVGFSNTEQVAAGPKAQISLNQAITQFSYRAARHSQSGPAYTLGAAYDRAFSGRLAARFGLTLNRVTAIDPQYASNSITGDLTVSRDFGHWTIYTRGSFTWLKGDADFALFGKPRNDRIGEADAGLVLRKLSLLGLSPQLRVTWIDAVSPIPLYRYRRLRSEVSLTKSF